MARTRSGRAAEVFISHSSRDRGFADKIATVLRAHGLAVWHAPTNIVGAQQWHDEIGAALARCTWFAIVLSKNALRSKWVKRELMYALQSDRYEGRIVPLLKTEADYTALSWTLASFQYVDFTGPFPRGCVDLLGTWGRPYIHPLRLPRGSGQ